MEKRTDSHGRVIWGSGPDRTCLNCYIGFSMDLLTKEGGCPKCGLLRHCSAIWNDGPIIPPKEAFPIIKGEGLWAQLEREYKESTSKGNRLTIKILYDFFNIKPHGK